MKKTTLLLCYLVTSFVTSQNLITNSEFQDINGQTINSWTHTPHNSNYIIPPAIVTSTHGTKAIESTTAGDYYAFFQGENGCLYQKVAVPTLESTKDGTDFTCTLIFNLITSKQTTGYGYAIEYDTALTPPDVATIINGSASLKTFCNNNGGLWTEFGATITLPAIPAGYTYPLTFKAPKGAKFVYICIGTKGAAARLELKSVTLEGIPYVNTTMSIGDFDKNAIAIYPNPANNELNITNIVGSYSYKITNTLGKTLKSNTNETSSSITISELTSGIYFIEITNQDNKKSMIKFVKA